MHEKVQEQSDAITRHQPVPLEACIQVEDVAQDDGVQSQTDDSVERDADKSSEEKRGQHDEEC